jgi:hypothetical protein
MYDCTSQTRPHAIACSSRDMIHCTQQGAIEAVDATKKKKKKKKKKAPPFVAKVLIPTKVQ